MILSQTHSSSTVNIQRGINEIFITIDVIKQHTHTYSSLFHLRNDLIVLHRRSDARRNRKEKKYIQFYDT